MRDEQLRILAIELLCKPYYVIEAVDYFLLLRMVYRIWNEVWRRVASERWLRGLRITYSPLLSTLHAKNNWNGEDKNIFSNRILF